jgi:iron complex outermembrane recepter protein
MQNRYLLAPLITSMAALFALPILATAQTAAPQSSAEASSAGQLEEVLVTAERKSVGESLQKVPIAITAVTAQTIETEHLTDITDIGRAIPNVELDPAGTFPGVANLTIRGVGVSSSTRSVDPAVNIFQDGMVIAYPAGAVLDTFDTESVQVLRGPQGVLFGRNSAGGAVVLSTPLPTSDFHYKGDVTFGNFDEIDAHAMVEGTLVGDTIFGKIAISEKTNSGYFNNTTDGVFVPAPGNPSGLPIEHESNHTPGTHELIIKPTFRFELSNDLELKLFTQYQRYRDGGGVAQSYIPPQGTITGLQTTFGYYTHQDGNTVNVTDEGYTDIDAGHVIAELDWNVGTGTLTTVAAARDIQYDSTFEADGTPFSMFTFPDNTEHNHQESLESRYNGKIGSQIEYVAGIYAFDDITEVVEKRTESGLSPTLPLGTVTDIYNNWRQHDTSDAVFGNIDYKPVADLTLSAGLRYETEFKYMHIIPLQACTGANFTGCPNTFYDDGKRWYGLTPRFVASYDLENDILLYASYAKGFSAGNFNARAPTIASAILPTNPESVDSYETGLKSEWFDHRALLNIAGYVAKYTSIQRTLQENVDNTDVQTLLNAADAIIKGFELETSLIVVEGLKLNASAGYTNAHFTSIIGLPAGVDGTSLKLDHVPDWTSDVGGTYTFPVAQLGGKMELATDYSYRTKVFTDVLNTPQEAQPAYGLLNASVSLDRGPYYFRLWGRNLTNQYYIYQASKFLGYTYYPGAPRTFGITIGASF